jgi:fermentation-respiration switch protein FrsA (DUF1100 family)
VLFIVSTAFGHVEQSGLVGGYLASPDALFCHAHGDALASQHLVEAVPGERLGVDAGELLLQSVLEDAQRHAIGQPQPPQKQGGASDGDAEQFCCHLVSGTGFC